MTAPLWTKDDTAPDEWAMRFAAGADVLLDREIFQDDIFATRAHVAGLADIELLTRDDAAALDRELARLSADFAADRFVLDGRYEDGHTAIEARLVERLGDLGKRVHLGRSRNDQVLAATRLYARRTLGELRRASVEAGRAALDLARRHERVVMPGYTHMQRAVPSTVGLWMASFAEAFADDARLLATTADWLNASPLGTAAGYGVNLALAREAAAKRLGFDRLQINPMGAQASRGKFEAQALAAAWQAAQTTRRLGWDLTFFSSAEFGFVTLRPEATTGSSIMPNKRNPDVAELLRTPAATVAGAMVEVQQTVSLPSGYHRDLQATKAPTIRGLRAALEAVSLVPWLLEGIDLHEDRMRAAIDDEMLATDRATALAAAGTPFRDAYRAVAASVGETGGWTAERSVSERVSPGACADLRLDEIEARLNAAAE